MKAIVYRRYGSPDVLEIVEAEKPKPNAREVLIKVHATTVTSTDCTFRKGDSFFVRSFTGLLRPKNQIPGDTLAGEVEAVGEEVGSFTIGDRVYGALVGFGACAEYVCLPEEGTTLAPKPTNMNNGEAAAVCDGALAALPFLRDTGEIQSGQNVLINGASGSVGSFAVQLAKYFGAEVTGVCSAANLEMVKSLGADRVIDYTKEEFTRNGETYDLIFDTVGKTSFSRCGNSLKPGGIFLEAAFKPTILPRVIWTSMFGGKKVRIAATGLRPPTERRKDLLFLKELAESGKLKSVIDKTYSLEQIAEAHRYVDTGRKKGNVVITFGNDKSDAGP